jgi:hypothetical protein
LGRISTKEGRRRKRKHSEEPKKELLSFHMSLVKKPKTAPVVSRRRRTVGPVVV